MHKTKMNNPSVRTRTTVLFVIFAFVLSLLAGCAEKSIGDETTAPLENIINGIINKDATRYKSAFPKDYIEAAEKAFADIGSDIDKEITEILEMALTAHESNRGKNVKLYYFLLFKEELSVKELVEEPYWDLHVNNYDLPKEGVQKVYLSTFEIKVKGKDSEETKTGRFRFLLIDGVWYLHPESFLYIF